jgi:hypothetical protein
VYGLAAYGAAAYAAPAITNATPPGQQIPPPVPGGTTAFTYIVQAGLSAWALVSWAGAAQVPVWPGGGIILVPDADRGVMGVQVWWPDAAGLLLVRITPDGVRTPVRHGYPATPTEATRRNYCTNPGLEAGLNGYVPADGSPTFSTVTGLVGSNALRATVASAGSLGLTVPHSLPVSSQATVGVALKFSARPTSLVISVAYTDSGGGALTTQTAALTDDQINVSVGQWGRQTVSVAAPAGAANVGSIKVLAGGMPAGGTMDVDAVTIEQGTTSGTAFDGENLAAIWTGTQHLSTSVLAPIISLADAECPLDTAVSYEAYYPAVVGGRVTSQPSLLPSNGRTWLTHPTRSSGPVVVDLRDVPTLEHDVEQGVFYPLDSDDGYPTVISGPRRRAPTGTVVFNAISRAERDQLMTLFADVSPVLLRSPAEFHYVDGYQWLSLGRLSEDREGRKAWLDAWALSAPFYEVAAPDASLVA